MSNHETANPLAWPTGWPRTKLRSRASFRCTFTVARQELADELDRLGAKDPILSTNLPLRLDSQPRGDATNPYDPGVAVYFTLKGRRLVLACDRWVRVEHNVRAIAKHVDAIRGMDRWGVGSIERAFTGYAALPAPGARPDLRPWREVLGVAWVSGFTADDVAEKFRSLARSRHPDTGGSDQAFAELARARDEALAEVRR